MAWPSTDASQKQVGAHLVPGGVLGVEVGAGQSGGAVGELLLQAGWSSSKSTGLRWSRAGRQRAPGLGTHGRAELRDPPRPAENWARAGLVWHGRHYASEPPGSWLGPGSVVRLRKKAPLCPARYRTRPRHWRLRTSDQPTQSNCWAPCSTKFRSTPRPVRRLRFSATCTRARRLLAAVALTRTSTA